MPFDLAKLIIAFSIHSPDSCLATWGLSDFFETQVGSDFQTAIVSFSVNQINVRSG